MPLSLSPRRGAALFRAIARGLVLLAGILLIVAVILRLAIPGARLWAITPDAIGLVLSPSITGGNEVLFPYSVPLTLSVGACLIVLAVRMSARARRMLLAAAGLFAAAAGASQLLIWDSATPASLAPMLLTGVAAASAGWALIAQFEREWLHVRLRKLVRDDAAALETALTALEARLGAVEQTQTRAQIQLRETAAQDERNRLARDLHDTIKQQLFSINMAAATAQSLADSDPQGSRDMVQEVRNLSQQAQVEMKALLTQLRPQPLATVGLVQAIKDQLEALHFRSEVAAEFVGETLPDERALPLGAQEAIFRVVQEALSNIARHARAKTARVELAHDSEAFTVRIADDGQGFDAAQAAAGMGLSNMRARIAELRGRLDVTSTAGAGTVISARLPLEKTAATVGEGERHRRLEQWMATAYLNSVSYVFGLTTVLFVAGAILGIIAASDQSASSVVNDAGIAGFGEAPIAVVVVAMGAIVGIPIAAVALQVIVRVRRRRLARLQSGDPDWWASFRHLMHFDDWSLTLNTVALGGWAAWLGRGVVDPSMDLALGGLAGLCLVIAVWSAARVVSNCVELSRQPENWATAPWLRAVVLQLALFAAADVLTNSLLVTTMGGARFTAQPRSVEDLSASLQLAPLLASSLSTLIVVIAASRTARRLPTALPGVTRFGVLRSDLAMAGIIVALIAGNVALLAMRDDNLLSVFSLVTVVAFGAAYGITRTLSPIREAANARVAHD